MKIKIISVFLVVFSTQSFSAYLSSEAITEYGDKVCIYSDDSTLTINGISSCPREYKNHQSKSKPKPRLTPIEQLERLGKVSLQNRYCSLLAREQALLNSVNTKANKEQSGNPIVAIMTLNTVTTAANIETERNRVAGVLENKHGIIMTEGVCNNELPDAPIGQKEWNNKTW